MTVNSEIMFFSSAIPRRVLVLRMPSAGHKWIWQEAMNHGLKPRDWLDQFLLGEIHWRKEQRTLPEQLIQGGGKGFELQRYAVSQQVHDLVKCTGGTPMVRALIQARINADPRYTNVSW